MHSVVRQTSSLNLNNTDINDCYGTSLASRYNLRHCNNRQEEMLDSLELDVTVTRRQDATFAPNGYIYNVYFDGETQVRTLGVYRLSCLRNLSSNRDNCCCCY